MMKYLLLTSVLVLSSCGYTTQEQQDNEKMSISCTDSLGEMIVEGSSITELSLKYKNVEDNTPYKHLWFNSFYLEDGLYDRKVLNVELPEEMTCKFKLYNPNLD